MTPKVSIVMAARNYARFLPMAIRSVQAQKFSGWELIVIDDGSTDDTPEVLGTFLDDARIHPIRSRHLGQPRAKNLGIEQARGEWIAFLDADDAWRSGKLATQLEVMEREPGIGVLATVRQFMNEQVLEMPPEPPGLNEPVTCEPIAADDLFVRNPVCFSSVLVRRQVFEHVGLFDPELPLAIDYDLWLRAVRHYRFATLNQPLTLYRSGHGNLSSRQAERITAAFGIMDRATRGSHPFSKQALHRGYASTCQSMAWACRRTQPLSAMAWYARSLQWPGLRAAAIKGMMGTLLQPLRGSFPRQNAGQRDREAGQHAFTG